MALDNNLEGNRDIAQFLEKFKENPFPAQTSQQSLFASQETDVPVRPSQYARSFEKLEQKMRELETKFEASTTQNQLILNELARTREVMERQKDKDAFLEHLSRTIATLRTSVENLSRAQETQSFSYRETPLQRSFDPLPTLFAPSAHESQTVQEQTVRELDQLRREREEQDRLFSSLRQKASQLKAVNSALDREIKKAQQEKTEALKKSADQAKEILSLRDQLTAAEERFKSFDFEGRIISIKQQYQQKVSSLETQLKEMSDTCVKQVEEIESLKAQNTKLQYAVAEKEALQAQLNEKEKELAQLQETITGLRSQNSSQSEKQLLSFTVQLRELEEQRDRVAVELEQSQMALETIRREKEVLETNFKELVGKINQNDVVIGELKEKIEVLGRQNRELSQHNEELTQTNTQLCQDNASLSKNNTTLTHRNAALAQHNATLARHTSALEQDKTTLNQRISELDSQNRQLSLQAQQFSQQAQTLEEEKQTLSTQVAQLDGEKKTLVQNNQQLASEKAHWQQRTDELEGQAHKLAEQNEQLRSQSAALLAARLVQQHARKENARQAAAESTAPVAPKIKISTLRRQQAPVLHSLGRTLPVSSTPEEEWEMISVKTPTAIKSEEDLPEIKVAEPSAQIDLFDGEDFLEKTDSFIGRMKWSIFRENR